MKVLYVTTYDSTDINQWSGSGYYIRKAMEDQGIEVEPFQVTGGASPMSVRLIKKAYRIMGREFLADRSPRLVRKWSRQVEAKAAMSQPDIIFSPGTTPVAFVRTPHALVIYGDATFDGLVELYPEYANTCGVSRRCGRLIDQAAWDRCDLAIFASDWAACTAREYYARPPRRISIVPLGANGDGDRTQEQVSALVEARPVSECRLLFAGVDWNRKGGSFAVEVVRELNARGVRATLDVVGCCPSGLPREVTVHGFISKSTPEGRRKIDGLFERSHFLILPTRAEAYGLVFCEAASFGVPSLANAVGGVPVIDGVTGLRFSMSAGPGEWAGAVAELLASPARYKQLAASAFAAYREEFNWNVAGSRLKVLLEDL